MEWIWLLVKILGLCGLSFLAILGLFTIYHVVRRQHEPADVSNRINKIRLWWFVLTREDLFVDVFPWLENDEYESIKQVRKKLF